MNTEPAYWDHVLDLMQRKSPDRLWRRYSDTIDSRLLASWLSAGTTGYLLKTDMFGESLGGGLRVPSSHCGWTTVGMDISPEMAKAARSASGYRLLVAADIRNVPFSADVIDTIFSNSTLDHFTSVDEIVLSLKECYRVLKPGGRLILTMDNPVNPVLALRSIIPHKILLKLHVTPYFSGKTLSPDKLRKALHDIGFHISDMHPVVHCPRIIAILTARIVDRLASARTKEVFLEKLIRFETLTRFPTRFLTGYFTAVCCEK
ncbi:MAG: class I SAM-dependent methyltransferase [Pseudomonadota bacterium]